MEILIIKTGALGDVLRTNFIAQGLKDKFGPLTKISWITSKGAIPLLENNPFINTIFLEENRYKLLGKRFDLVINLEEDLENVKFTTKISSKKKIGFILKNKNIVPTKTAKYWFDMSLLGKKPQNNILKMKNNKTHNKILSEMVGLAPEQFEPRLAIDPSQKTFASRFAKKHKFLPADKIIGINVGSSKRWRKELPIKKTISLINNLSKRLGAKIILFGGSEEIERNQKIFSKTSSLVIDSGCDNSLKEYIAIMSLCSMVISTDTLGLHISLALKRKTIALIGPTSTSEVGMYNLGAKINPDSNCLCCYRPNCNSMEKMSVQKIITEAESLLKEKVVILITSFNEPNTIGAAIEHALAQTTNHSFEILVSAPDKETIAEVNKYSKKHKQVKLFRDPGKGKSFALNLVFEHVGADILILTDGDVTISPNSVESILESFEDPLVGCLTGRPIALEDYKTKYGYWANFLFDAAHKMRSKANSRESFLECSGYLFAFRKAHINKIPLDTAEDTIIPYMFWEKGFKISYVPQAEVKVKNVTNWKEWISQKTRTSKGHETVSFYANIKETKREKTFFNEIKYGFSQIFSYPKNFREAIWTFELVFARLYMWLKVHFETSISSNKYQDNWKPAESTK